MQNYQQLKKISWLVMGALALGLFFYFKLEPTTPDNTAQLVVATDDESSAVKIVESGEVIEIEMTSFKFSQDRLVVKVGQEVIIKLTNLDGFHDFVIDELGISSEQIFTGDEDTITFTIPQESAGKTYEYYCSVGNHRQLGMVGKLVVEDNGDGSDEEMIQLKDVSGGDGSGTAYILRKNGQLSHRVEAKLPVLEPGLAYEGWLVSKTPTLKFFSTGVMKQEEGMFTLSYEVDSEYLGYNEVVVTLETKIDDIPEKHILEGAVR